MRTHLCGTINEQLDSSPVTLCGWVDRRRDLGGLIFLRLRDTSGLVQVVIEPDSGAVFESASKLRNEYCVRLNGVVRMRPESQWNLDMATGKIEVVATEIELFNASEPMPFRAAVLRGIGAANKTLVGAVLVLAISGPMQIASSLSGGLLMQGGAFQPPAEGEPPPPSGMGE